MTKIPTAEEFCREFRKLNPIAEAESIEHWMGRHCIEFTKLHVKAALEAAATKATATIEYEYDDQPSSSMPPSEYPVVNKKTISNAYPETLIK